DTGIEDDPATAPQAYPGQTCSLRCAQFAPRGSDWYPIGTRLRVAFRQPSTPRFCSGRERHGIRGATDLTPASPRKRQRRDSGPGLTGFAAEVVGLSDLLGSAS